MFNIDFKKSNVDNFNKIALLSQYLINFSLTKYNITERK